MFDRIPPVTEYALLTIQKGNGAFGSTRILIPFVEGNQTGLVAEVIDVDSRFILSANHKGKLIRLAVYA